MRIEQHLKGLGIQLPPPPKPVANYTPVVRVGNLLFLAGHGALDPSGKPMFTGKVGKTATIEQGAQAARATALACLSTIKSEIADLDKVRRIVKLLVMVNCDPSFDKHFLVGNGASDLLVQVFGESKGKHARSSVGMSSLPFDLCVEIEMIVEVQE
jgi:enamine deaminase RidA (YjgF/YER057c/UK114 family)